MASSDVVIKKPDQANPTEAVQLGDKEPFNQLAQTEEDIDQRIAKSGSGSISDVRARAYLSASQTITTGVSTKLTLNAESYDTGNNFDATTNHRFTAPEAGWYVVAAKLYISGLADGKLMGISIYKNGSNFSQMQQHTGSANDATSAVSDIMKLVAGDYIEVYADHNHGSDRDAASGEGNTYLAVHLIST